jgi:hypothetical protein
MTLRKYAEKKTNSQVARDLGVTREAIGQMLDSDREIYVEKSPAGGVTAWEKRSIPVRRRSAA